MSRRSRPRCCGALALLAVPLLAVVLGGKIAPQYSSSHLSSAASGDTVAALIQRRLAGTGSAGLHAPELVRRFYAGHGHAPAWSSSVAVTPHAEALARAFQGAEVEGLDPEGYGMEKVAEVLERVRDHHALAPRLSNTDRVDLDLLLTDAFLTYGVHLARGRVDPRTIHPGWSLPPRTVDVVASLQDALRTGRMEESLSALAPATPEYRALRRALQRYHDLAARGGWSAIPDGPTLRPGDRGDAVIGLRRRLAVELRISDADLPEIYDPTLETAVRDYQRSRGLRDDGAVGPATRAALNVPAGSRAEQIVRSMERLRWLPDDLGRRHVRVSIPGFELTAIENNRPVLAMRIVGGRPELRTPIFSARMTSVVFSPYWNIPPSIAAAEVLPRARRDPEYLRRNGIHRVPDGAGYQLRQDPGPLNPLGGVKFLFPNPYNTYLHDTPAKHLFAEPERAFSHGCMRVEQPLELAVYVLQDLGWDREEIRAAMARGVERTVALRDPIPVHVLYQTAWVDTAGRVHFRDDLYGHDRRLAAALAATNDRLSEQLSGDCILATR